MDFSSSISKSSKTVGACFLRIFNISIATLLISHCALGTPSSSTICRYSLKFAVTTIWLSIAFGRTYLASSFGISISTNFVYINCCNHLSCGQKRFPLKPLQGFRGQRGGAPLLNSSSLSNSNRRTLSLNHQTLRKFDQNASLISRFDWFILAQYSLSALHSLK